jgi:dynein heavy chain
VRIVRILTTPYGHALLIGVGGSGKKSLSMLSSFIADLNMYRIEVTKSYDIKKEWIEDQQALMRQCGVSNIPTTFMFNDTQIFNEMVLEDISSILNQGEIPNLFPPEEKAKICEDLSAQFSRETDSMSNNQKYGFFTKICKNNLHMIITVSPVGDDYRKRLRTFPSLINCSTLDWFLPWPADALKSVASYLLEDLGFDFEKKKKVSAIFVDMQAQATKLTELFLVEHKKYYYVTPSSYLEL